MITKPPRSPITLSTGRIVEHKRLSNDAQEAYPTSGPEELTDDEWIEYCDKLVASLVK